MSEPRKQLIAECVDVERLYDEMVVQLAPKMSDDVHRTLAGADSAARPETAVREVAGPSGSGR